ncbi:MAG: prepilin peptidase [Phycisphaerae bacterium]
MEIFWLIFLFVLGASIGSFLNVVVWRYPRGESIVFPGSHCPSCGKAIRAYDNIPVLSWLILRGRCRQCGVKISARYIVVETMAGCLVAGLWVAYYLLGVRDGVGAGETIPAAWADSWMMFAAHGALLLALLVCSLIDLEYWILPIEACWIVALFGAAMAAADPHPWMPAVSPVVGAMSIAAGVGLVLSLLAVKFGFLERSFIDADGAGAESEQNQTGEETSDKKSKRDRRAEEMVVTSEHGVNPRLEIVKEVVFLAPAGVLAVLTWAALTYWSGLDHWWTSVASRDAGGYAPHVNALLSSLFGFLIGGLWIWGARILGTLGVGKEAMGMGDVHLLAAVGAVTGWIVPSLTFWIAPLVTLLMILWTMSSRKHRALPYGPGLAAGTIVVMLAYDLLIDFIGPAARIIAGQAP